MLVNLGTLSYLAVATFFGILCILLLTRWKGRLNGTLLFIFCFVSTIWSLSAAYSAQFQYPITYYVIILELLRDIVWAFYLIRLMVILNPNCKSSLLFRFTKNLILGIPVILIVLVMSTKAFDFSLLHAGFEWRILGQVFIAILGLSLLEQICRNTDPEIRWSLKFFCFGVAAFFTFDFYLYADALLFEAMDSVLWFARPWVYIIALILIYISLSRNPKLKSNVKVSRAMVFYTTAFVLTGIYLIIMSAGGFYLRAFGGDWGVVISTAFLFAGVLGLVILFYSSDIRARLRVFIDKHFLDYKYDYRDQWLGLIRELSISDESSRIEKRALHAITEMVDSTGGSLWVRKNQREFSALSQVSMPEVEAVHESTDGSLSKYLENWQWVVNLKEYQNEPEFYRELELPNWLKESKKCWLIVPLMLQSRLYGFIVLLEPRTPREFNWEDIDLLKTAGRQVAIHLAQDRAALALVQARQFEAFNRFSAYVVHDLKNLVSQLALVVKNAEKHKHNPAFMDDAIDTVDNSVERMNRLLSQLRAEAIDESLQTRINLKSALSQVIKEKSNSFPTPILKKCDDNLCITGNENRLISVIGHLVQNAQDATAEPGFVNLNVESNDEFATITIEDNGSGMEQSFIDDRLFVPFDTTKGLTGMGIGAHESRSFIEELGGSINVASQLGKGTIFTLSLPVYKTTK